MLPARKLPSTLNKTKTPATLSKIYKISSVPQSLNHCNQTRNMRNMTFFPQLSGDELTPLFHLLDGYDTRRTCIKPATIPAVPRTFKPNFDVRELTDSYRLDGDVPGINQKDIEIEFSDPQTLVIKGRSRRDYSSTTNANEKESSPSPQPEPEQQSQDESGSTSPHQPTVEDENEDGTSSTAATATPTSVKDQVTTKSNPTHLKKNNVPDSKYWISERSVGEFRRTFSFPARVDQDAVHASLRDGVLSVVVPKAPEPTFKKIRID